jgi:uncharacterized protein (DUF433 family)
MAPDRLSDWLRPKREHGRRRENFPPLIKPSGGGDFRLSFYNALEAHVLLSTLRIHKVSMLNVRRAVDWVGKQLPSPHPLIDYKFQTDGKHMFVSRLAEERVEELTEEGATPEQIYNASLQGQEEMGFIVDLFLKRIHRTESGLARRLFPIVPGTNGETEPVMMDMDLASGQLVIADTGIMASVVYGRYKAGHSVEKLASDYRLAPHRIQGAIDYLQSAA